MDHRETIVPQLASERKALGNCHQNLIHDDEADCLPSKPPLLPSSHHKYYSKSVCTKSTASATYVSSDDEDDDDDDDEACAYGKDVSFLVPRRTRSSDRHKSSGTNRPLSMHPVNKGAESDPSQVIATYDSPSSTSSEGSQSRFAGIVVRDDSDLGDMCTYFDEEESVYYLTSQDTSASSCDDDATDVEKLIAESSARWKANLDEVVSKSSTAKFTYEAKTVPSALCSNQAPMYASPCLQRPKLAGSCTQPISDAVSLAREIPSPAAKRIEEQQAEIERLRDMLQAQRSQLLNGRVRNAASPGASMLSDYVDAMNEQMISRSMATSRFINPHVRLKTLNSVQKQLSNSLHLSCPADLTPETFINDSNAVTVESHEVRKCSNDVAPVEHIEVRLSHEENDDLNSCCWHDDLTVGSCFNVSNSVVEKRPDADDGTPSPIASPFRVKRAFASQHASGRR